MKAVEVALAVDVAAVGVDGMMLAAVGARGGMRSAFDIDVAELGLGPGAPRHGDEDHANEDHADEDHDGRGLVDVKLGLSPWAQWH